MRNAYIAGNWKMHKTRDEATALAKELAKALDGSSHKVMIAPPFTALDAVSSALKGSTIVLGAQNMAPERSGAHTGEVSVDMLIDAGATTVILGHSERRHVYGESDELINRKVQLALEAGIDVILCVGETLEERDAGRAESVVVGQLDSGLAGVSAEALKRVTIAYEPVWAIGTGKTATPADAEAIHKLVRETISTRYGTSAAESMIIQYGGSVKPENIRELMEQPDIDGALVGGASLKAETFVPIAQYDKQKAQ